MNAFSAHVATSEQLTTPSSCQAALSDLLHAIDEHDGPIALHDIEHALFALRRAIDASGITAGPELEAETIAFFVRPATERNSAWGGYFGQAWQEPTLARVSKDTLGYWKERSQSARHPVLRARYADLLWDLPKSAKIDAAKPDHESARLAIDAYLEAVDGDRFDHALDACAGALRALELATSLGDSERISRSRDAILRLDREHATDESIGLWVGFDNLVEPPHKRAGLSVQDRDRLVAEMESRLQRFSTAPASRYHPSGAEASAVRLASFYRRLDRAEDVRRVMLRYADTVRGMKGHAEPLVVSHCLAG
ncbi:hypothetical protein [Gemmatimonas sp.]|jgi:hypothetical protein|uniref:DUF7380 domain-containing protein n=1 Tax=Gemmatimonas sp. TaxID=1962908 RepID=UPI0037C12C64